MPIDLPTLEQTLAPAVLRNAAAFIAKGKVDELEETAPGSWIAFVRGAQDFDVQIRLDGTAVIRCACDCGADTMPCEHAVAVLLTLRDRLGGKPAKPARKTKTGVEKKPARKKKETFDDILNRVPPEELKAFLKEAFGRQRDFRNMFMARFSEPDDTVGKEGYTKLVKNILRSGVSRWGYIDGRGLRKIVKPMNELLRQAQIQLDKKQYLGPVQLGQVLLEEISERFATDMDNSGYLQDFIRQGLQFFEATFASDFASQTLKNDLWDYLLAQCPNPKYLDYGGDFHQTMMELLVEYAAPGAAETRLHGILDECLRKATAPGTAEYLREFRRNYWLGWKIDLYRRHNRTAEANALVDANLHIPEFRRIKIEAAIEAERWEEAEALLQEALAHPQHPNITLRWKQLQLRIAQLRGDRARIRALGLELFRTDHFRLEHFKIVKASYPPAEWPAAARAIIDDLAKHNHIADFLLPVLEEEQDWPGMLARIRKEGRFDLLLRYEAVMLEYFPHEAENLYVAWLRQTASQASNRDDYKQVAALLQNLVKYPTGAEQAAALLRDLQTRYGRRPAMLEELAKVKF